MLIGLLPDVATTETLLNNLVEAGFDLHHVSVVMRDARQRAAIMAEAGPLQGTGVDGLTQHLLRFGFSPHVADSYAAAVRQGKILVAIDVPETLAAAAREMLDDHAAQLIQGSP